jgi:hypothetical protein
MLSSIPDFFAAIEDARKNSRQPSILLVFLLVSEEQRSRRISLFPNEGIEQVGRKNDGASAKARNERPRAQHREQICDYADVEGDGYNPFRNLNGQMIANISAPRPNHAT